MDCILGHDCQIFQNADVQDLQHNSNYYMLLGFLRSASPGEHSRYLGRRMGLPLCPPRRQTRTRADNIFVELRHAVPKLEKTGGMSQHVDLQGDMENC